MFTEEELKEYEKDFNEIGVMDNTEQQQILDFIYSFAVIAYDSYEC